ncbi:Glycoside hydrolase family 5 domain-containing protein [Methylorubrum aminovorans]
MIDRPTDRASRTARLASLLVAGICLATLPARSETLRSLASAQVVSNLPFDVQVAAAKDLGLRRARIGIRIYEVEKAGGTYDWSATDTRIRGLMAAGLTPIVTLFGRTRLTERGPAGADGRVPLSDPEIRAFADFSAQVARRYGAMHEGRQIIYEIWNEPNTKTFWGSPPDPEAYARLAETTCHAIHNQAPTATVIGLAMEGTPLNKPHYVRSYGLDIYREWAGRAATPQLLKCLNGVSFHPYRREPETYLTENAELLRFLSEHGWKDKNPLIVNSEWGYSVGARNAADADEQAALDVRLLLIGAGFQRITNLYQLTDGGTDPGDVRHQYGLFTSTGTPKPAGSAITRLLKAIGDYEIDGVASAPELSGVIRFRANQNGQRKRAAEVLWRSSGETAVSVDQLGARRPVLVKDLVSDRDLPPNAPILTVGRNPLLLLFEVAP